MDRPIDALPTEQILWQRFAVAKLIGYAEGIASSGILGEPMEPRLRAIIAETLSAFGMQSHDERNAA